MVMRNFKKPISQDVDDLIGLFLDHKVEFLVIGAYAVMVYSEPRFTKDIDFWVNPSPTNSFKVFAALKEFGAPLSKLSVEDFSAPGYFYTMGIPPGRMDILMSVANLDFDSCYASRSMVEFGPRTVPVISMQDLILAKIAAGRPQDLLDLQKLQKKA